MLLLRRTLVRLVILFINKKTTETQGQGEAQCSSVSLWFKNVQYSSERTRVRRNNSSIEVQKLVTKNKPRP